MAKKCFIDVDTQTVKDVLDEVKNKPERGVMIIPVVTSFETFAPTKKKPNHRIKFEVVFAPEAFKPEYQDRALTDFGTIVCINLDRKKIDPQYLKNVVDLGCDAEDETLP